MPNEKPKPSSTSEASPIPGWGKVSPASLVNTWVSLRMPGEDKYVAHLIKAYDAETVKLFHVSLCVVHQLRSLSHPKIYSFQSTGNAPPGGFSKPKELQ